MNLFIVHTTSSYNKLLVVKLTSSGDLMCSMVIIANNTALYT